MRARVRKKGMVLTEMKGFSGTFTHQKNKRKYYTEMGIKKGVPLNSNLC